MHVIEQAKAKKSILLRIAILAFIGYVLFSIVSLQTKIHTKRAELDEVQKQIVLQEITIEGIEYQLNTNEKEYMERLARDELDYVKPGERVFINIAGK